MTGLTIAKEGAFLAERFFVQVARYSFDKGLLIRYYL